MIAQKATSPQYRGRYNNVPTVYNGRRYRSRTEASWGVFLDALEIRHWYEPRKFDFGDDRYIPDFHLPVLGAWLEIKGGRPTAPQRLRIQHLAQVTGENTFILFGLPFAPDDGGRYGYGCLWGDERLTENSSVTWATCPICGSVELTPQGRADVMRCRCVSGSVACFGDEDAKILRAFAASRAFYEHPDNKTTL